ncbi:MAG: rhodanese-like domain-containing protein [Pyrinomonadaceae bacterium]
MRLLISFALCILLGFALLSCNSTERNAANSHSAAKAPPTAPVIHADGVRRITTVELQDLLSKGQAFVVDVRTEASYNTGHIKGAKLIPLGEILNHVNELPRDKTIVTYCS